jgi:hypothetical protein
MTELTKVVAPENIEKALAELLGQLSEKKLTKASLFNLIIYVGEAYREDYIQLLIQKVNERYPSRILLFVESDHLAPLETTVSVLPVVQGENTIYCDYIRFQVGKQDRKIIPYLVLPYLITDLPNFLLWIDDPNKHDPLNLKLEQIVSRIIFDSETSLSLDCFAKSVLTQKQQCKKDIADLNWARTESFRSLIASLFYNKEKLDQLNQVSKIVITYNVKTTSLFTHSKIQSIYLALWMATQLNWTFKSSKPNKLLFKTKDNPVEIVLQKGSDDTLGTGRILSLELFFTSDEHYFLKRKPSNLHLINIYHSFATYCETPSEFLMNKEDSGHSLVNEIFQKGTSDHFLTVLKFIAENPLGAFAL